MIWLLVGMLVGWLPWIFACLGPGVMAWFAWRHFVIRRQSGDKSQALIVVNEVIPHLFIGGRSALRYIGILEIDTILDLTRLKPPACVGEARPAVNWRQIPLRDVPGQEIASFFDDTNKYIDQALSKNKNVLVHCEMGISRSATIVVAYLRWKFDMTSHEALTVLRSKRPMVEPNLGFLRQLDDYVPAPH